MGPQFSVVVRLLESRARLGVVRRTGLGADRVPRRRHKEEEAGERVLLVPSAVSIRLLGLFS